MVGHQSTVYIWDAKKATLQWERPFSYSFGSVYNRDLFVTTCSRDASFFISISDCHCIYSFGRTGDQTEQDEGSFGNQLCIQRLGKSINRCKRKFKKKRKKENNLNEVNTQYEYEKRTVWKWKYSTLGINVDSFQAWHDSCSANRLYNLHQYLCFNTIL